MTKPALSPAITPASITVEACGKTFADGTKALTPIDLAIEAGESMVLLGPSGCGKTTLLRMIAGFEQPDPGGRIRFGGEDVTRRPVETRRIGMVFQSYALFPNMTVAGNIGYGLKLMGLDRAAREARVGEMLDMMRITDLAPRQIDQLSGGQRQRVALARALAVRPRALLLDEPLTALDARLRETLRREIGDLLRQLAITAVFVTHDQDEAMTLGDRIAVMAKGRIEQIGRPRDIYERPHTAFVADFIGTLNRLPGIARNGHLHLPGGRLPWPDAGPKTGSGERQIEGLIRPERLRLVPEDQGQLRGRLTAARYLGQRLRLEIADIAPTPVIVEAPAQHLDLTLGATVHLAADDGALFYLAEV